ncbi:MAG: glycogen synthase GlgA [Bacteroidales bacterium]|nr:glycogen synthase GlgA [Bacteroidales bacterium]
MAKSLKILMVASECIPYAMTGGMGDVVGSLPPSLQRTGADVRIVIPKYSFIDTEKYNIVPFIESMGVWMGNKQEWCSVYKTVTAKGIPVYFIEYNLYFDREGLYHDAGYNDYQDNPKRFAFLSRAALQLCQEIHFIPDIVHANDWPTALLPVYLKIWHRGDPILGKAASVLTIHNLAYQGRYSKESYNYLGLGEINFTSDKFECHGAINLLKGGIYYADFINTVSPGYARETITPEGGFGLDPFLRNKESRYIGILNGADYSIWDPETDILIPANYSMNNLKGKRICKKSLQEKMNLDPDPELPVIGVVSRFTWQKGLDLLIACIANIFENMKVQFAILGSGDNDQESFFGKLPGLYPGKAGSYIGYNNELAHLIEAGCDFFLMPSVYEPCGLNQIYSLKYGTVPIVRATGGLDDTVSQYDPVSGSGTGFKFSEPSTQALYQVILQAVKTYHGDRALVMKLIRNGMQQHYSWEDSAIQYMDLYRNAVQSRSE